MSRVAPSPLAVSARRVVPRIRAIAEIDLENLRVIPAGRVVIPTVAVALALWFGLARLTDAGNVPIGFGQMWQPIIRDVFTESLLFMVLAVAIGLFGRTLGMLLVAAFGVADFAYWVAVGTPANVLPDPYSIVGRLSTYAYLWILVVVLPMVQRRVHAAIAMRTRSAPAAAASSALAFAALVWLWAVPGPFMIRPAFAGSPPGFEPVWQLQYNSEILAGLAGVVTLAVAMGYQRRIPFQEADGVAVLDPDLWGTPAGRIVRILVALALLMGFMTSWLDLAIVGTALVIAGFVVPWLARRVPVVPRARRLSLPVAGLVGVGLAAVLAAVITSVWFQPSPTEFFPLVLSIALSAVALSFVVELLGPGQAIASAELPRDGGLSHAGLMLLASGATLAYLVLTAEPALAEDCADLSDCTADYVAAKVWALIVSAAAVAWTFLTGLFDKTPPPLSVMQQLLSGEGAEAQRGELLSLQDAVAKQVLAATGDTDEFSRIKGLTPADFATEALAGKWKGLFGSPAASTSGGSGISIGGSRGG